jgi:hypothetical protein
MDGGGRWGMEKVLISKVSDFRWRVLCTQGWSREVGKCRYLMDF